MVRRAELLCKDYADEDEVERDIRISVQTKKYSEPVVLQSVIPLTVNDKLALQEKYEQRRLENVQRRLRGQKPII